MKKYLLFTFTFCFMGMNLAFSQRVIKHQDLRKKMQDRNTESTITLKESENIFDGKHDLNVTFVSTIKDDRCPENYKCGTAGEAIIEIQLMSIYSRPQNFQLSTNEFNKKIHNYIIFNGYEVSIVELTPFSLEPMYDKNVVKTVKLKVKKHELQSDDSINKKPNPNERKLLENWDFSTNEFHFEKIASDNY